MLTWKLAATLAATLAAASALPVKAQQARNCADRARVLDMLKSGYSEDRQSIGISANNTVIEVFASPETGTWTITATLPNGQTCILVSGRSFESTFEEVMPAKGELL